jgi:Tfp pilus assembly protein PilV
MSTERSSLADERGVALIIALLAMVLLTALGLALTLVTMTEARIAASYRDGVEALYAADAVLERLVQDVGADPDWNRILDGSAKSAFVDGAAGQRTLPDGSILDLAETTAVVRCGKPTCSDADLDASTEERPWGANNPRWQLYAYGPLADMSPATINSRAYVVAWVADDPSENDGRALIDGEGPAGTNPGRAVLSILVHGYGGSGARRVIAATIVRTDLGVRMRTWREIR